jgi:hypothetical protein
MHIYTHTHIHIYIYIYFFPQYHHMSSQTSWSPPSEVGTPIRRGYVVPMRMMGEMRGESVVPGGGA